MASIVTESIGWSADSAGEKLTVSTPFARSIAATCEPGKKYTVDIKPYRPKRSLDANALYWSMLTKFATAIDLSTPEAHNMMLRRYGQYEKYGDQFVYVVLPDTDEAAKKADFAETYHLKPTSQVKEGKDGQNYRTYMLLRGSSTYDTKEMSRLIDGLYSECREVGLDVIPDKERGLLNDQ